MLVSDLKSPENQGRIAMETLERKVTYLELAERVQESVSSLIGAGVRGLCIDSGDPFFVFSWAAACVERGLPVVLGSLERLLDWEDHHKKRVSVTHSCDGKSLSVLSKERASEGSLELGPKDVVIMTSGTTGKPKLAVRSWESLGHAVHERQTIRGRRWLLTYEVNRYAGLQVFLFALRNAGTLIYSQVLNFENLRRLLLDKRPHCVSATPTFWNQILRTVPRDELMGVPMEVATLGGEACSQKVLDALKEIFPKSKLTHIYASTEAGVGISVSDGLAGLPVEILEKGHRGTEIKIVDGELLLRTPTAIDSYLGGDSVVDDDGFVASGDMVHVESGRIIFTGRKSARLNIGGFKVDPTELEDVANSVAGIVISHFKGRPNPILGQILVCDIVVREGHDPQKVVGALREVMAKRPRHHFPRDIRVVDEIACSASGKIKRNGNEDQ